MLSCRGQYVTVVVLPGQKDKVASCGGGCVLYNKQSELYEARRLNRGGQLAGHSRAS